MKAVVVIFCLRNAVEFRCWPQDGTTRPKFVKGVVRRLTRDLCLEVMSIVSLGFTYCLFEHVHVSFVVLLHPITMWRRSIASLLLPTYALVQTATGTCYFRNGTAQPDPAYAACSNQSANALSTVCCASWDTCLPNGLCQSSLNQLVYRESCTIRNWDDGGCQELCSNEVGWRDLRTEARLTKDSANRKEIPMSE
jgi:hypothetical protein